MGQTENNEAYEQGVQEGKESGFLDDFCHSAGKVFNSSDEDDAYDEGFQYGIEHKND